LIAPLSNGRFPLAGRSVQAFDQEGFAARAPRGGKVQQQVLTAYRRFKAQRDDGVDQRVDAGTLTLDAEPVARPRVESWPVATTRAGGVAEDRLERFRARRHRGGLPLARPPRQPGAVHGQADQDQHAQHGKGNGEGAHTLARLARLRPPPPG
jgi:hypothetical protein